MINCTGASTCKLGICLPRGLSDAIRDRLEDSKLDLDQLTNFRLNMSGCPNTCGMHHIADLGFFGKVGRKNGLYVGIAVFVLGSVISLFSSSFLFVILGRFLQGVGAASTRVISVAIVRDVYSGREMARIMSFIMAVFIFVPVIAPLVGEGILIFFRRCNSSYFTWYPTKA